MTLVALPVRRGVLAVEHIEVDRSQRHPVPREQFAERAERAAFRIRLDGQLVGRHHGAVVGDGDLLRPEQHLGRARGQRIGLLAEDVPKQDLRQLRDEQRRHVDAFAAEESEVRGLQRIGGHETLRESAARCHSFRAHRHPRSRRAPLAIRRGGDWRAVRRAARARSGRTARTGASSGRARKLRRKSSVTRSVPSAAAREQPVTAASPEIRHRVHCLPEVRLHRMPADPVVTIQNVYVSCAEKIVTLAS